MTPLLRSLRCLGLALAALTAGLAPLCAADYALTDPALKLVPIDSDAHESFLGLAVDGAGRLFAGSREGLFVYEPDPHGLYQPKRELYRFPKSTWIYDIAVRGHDLYVLTVAALYVFRDGVTAREGLKPERLLWGVPVAHVHQGLHGMTFGPDGDLYLSQGDQLWYYGDFRRRPDHWGHWTIYHGPDNTPTAYTGSGGVLRLSPDGKQLSSIANGTRNDCGLAFDAQWNLFGSDNDHESMPADYVPGRLLHITPHAYFNWPRGWMPEKQPWRSDLLETMTPDLGRYVPVGMTYYGDTLLPEKYRNALFVPEWGSRKIAFYPLQADGATFKTTEQILLQGQNDARPVSVTTGRDGRLFAAICYMAHNEESPMYRTDLVMITRAEDPPDAPFKATDEVSATTETLFGELKAPDWSRRFRAHLELTRRGGETARLAAEKLNPADPGSPDQAHLIWLAASNASEATRAKVIGLTASDSPLRLPAVCALARFGAGDQSGAIFTKVLADPDPRLRLAALIGLFDQTTDLPWAETAKAAGAKESYLRQTAAFLLARRATVAQLQTLCESPELAQRCAGILATGFRLTVPAWDQAPGPSVPLDGSNKKTYHVTYAGGITEDLAARAPMGNFTIADAWAKRTKTSDDETLYTVLDRRLQDADPNLAKQAAFFLHLLGDPRDDATTETLLGSAPAPQNKTPIANATTAVATELPEAFRKIDWATEVTHGDVKHGQELFAMRGCAICHAIRQGEAGGGGPSLAGAGTRFNIPYIVESVMIPNKVVAPIFRWTVVKLKNGEVVNGLVTSETAAEVEFLLPAGIHRTVKKDEIVSREIQGRSPMPEGLIQTPEDLRDLVVFLLSLKANQP